MSRDGAQIDDRTAASPLHLRGRRLHRPEESLYADCKRAFGCLDIEFRERLKPGPDRIVDERCDGRGEFRFNLRKHRLDVLAPTDVDCITARFNTLRLQTFDGRLKPPRADIHGGETPALASEALRNGEADSARRARHDANAILQPRIQARALCGAWPKAFAISRNWYFCTFPAGVFGRSATISTRSGQYCLATLCSAI
jgi:hypothetical protein